MPRTRPSVVQEPVAIIGMACRAPGGLSSPNDLWAAALDKQDLVAGAAPDSRWGADEWIRPADLGEARMLDHGAYLEGIDQFDPGFFGIPGLEAPSVDPHHRLLMETTWEALENAGVPPRSLAGSRTGLFVGLSSTEYAKRFAMADFDVYQGISAIASGAPGRISYVLDVNGPSVALDGACASSLMAVHTACRSLQSGESDLALAGGVTVQLDMGSTVGFARAGVLSERGRCAAFDSDADGFVRGEGCGMLALKRLEDARRDGDPVIAVIKGTAINHVGRSRGIAQPSRPAQRAAFQSALDAAGLDPGDVGYIETHGTGTPVGDPIEFESMADVYGAGDEPCALGSLKTNIGHAESASGVLGMIKSAMAVRTGEIAPNLHFRSWNPEIDADATRFYVPVDRRDWNPRGRRVAGVSAFGVTGSNAHVVLEEPDHSAVTVSGVELGRADTGEARKPSTPLVFPVSARSKGGLGATSTRLADDLDQAEERHALRDVAHTLAERRSHLSTRACVVSDSRQDLVDGLRAVAAGEETPTVVRGTTSDPGMPVFVFSGHGSQWAGMARDLLEADETFAATIDRLDPVAAAEAGVSLRRQLTEDTLPERMDVVQPLVFGVQCALTRMWEARGVRPAAVIGHSMGEAAAAVAAGIISPEDGMRITTARSNLLHRLSCGAMASVALPADQVASEIDDLSDVDVAVVTAPSTTVVAGDTGRIDTLLQAWESSGLYARRISVPIAAHSYQVEPLLPEIADTVAWLDGASPQVRFYSATDHPADPVHFDGAYWTRNLRQPVRFDRAGAAAIEDGHRVFLEVSPHPVLISAVEEMASAVRAPVITVGSLLRGEEGLRSMACSAARLHIAGVDVDLGTVNGPGMFVPLPPTAFDRSRYWEEADTGASRSSGHMWLDAPLTTHDPDAADHARTIWPADLGTDRVEWLSQHTLRGTPVVPGAAYVELMLTVAAEHLRCPAHEATLTDVRFAQLVPLTDTVPVQVHAFDSGTALRIEIWHRAEGDWELLARTSAQPSVPGDDGSRPGLDLLPRVEPGPMNDLYQRFARIGLDSGPAFQSIVAAEDGTVRLQVSDEATVRSAPPTMHPALFDGCVLAVASCLPDAQDPPAEPRPWLPEQIGRIAFAADPNTIAWARPSVEPDTEESATGRADLYDTDGVWVGAIEDVRLVKAAGASAAQRLNSRLFELVWRPDPLPDGYPDDQVPVDHDHVDRFRSDQPATQWVLLREPGDADGFAERIAAELRRGDDQVQLMDVDAAEPAGRQTDQVVWCATGTVDDLDRVQRIIATLRRIAPEQGGETATPRLWVASRSTRAVLDSEVGDPGIGSIHGLIRVASFEHPATRMSWVDADHPRCVAAELRARTPETETAWRDGQRYVARMVRAPLAAGAAASTAETVDLAAGQDGYALRAASGGGTLDQLAVTRVSAPTPSPGPGQVLVRVRATTVHFRDVMVAFGIYPTEDGRLPELGGDASGDVLAVGSGVDHVRPGDQVVCIVPGGAGTMRSHVLADGELTVPAPAGVDPTALGATPLTYLTAWHCLRYQGRLAAGETVLVHSAAGGVGMAAVEVARLVDARVIATAGTHAKREYLRRHGVEHVFDSRTLDFADQVRELTGGRGVDVVLNSLTGDAMRASLGLLAPRGRFIEIGKRDVYDGRRVELSAFRAENSYAAVDIDLTLVQAPELGGAALRAIMAEIGAGRLPLLPYADYPLTEAPAAFKELASGDLIGRIVLEHPADGEIVPAVTEPVRAVRPGGAYVITGGSRGLGVEAARWLAEAGAGRVVLGGRSELPAETTAGLAELTAHGCEVEFVRGDITDPETARRLVAAAGDRLCGVLHTAVVLDDAPLSELTADRLARVWHPKVSGLQHLHAATAEVDLDWLVVFSSMSAMLGNPGQANYAVAGSWVDTFAQARDHAGRRTLSVNWGAWGEAGRATEFADRGFDTIGTAEGFGALAALLEHRRVNTGMFSYQPELMFRAFPEAADAPLLAELGGQGDQSAASGVSEALRAERPGPARARLIQEVVTGELAGLLGTDPASLPAHDTFTNVGVDSLLAVALSRRLSVSLDLALSPAAIWANPSAAQLAAHLDDVLGREVSQQGGIDESAPART